MKAFSQLYKTVDSTTKTNEKVNALFRYFSAASNQDKLWAIALFSHKRPRRTIQVSFLRQWAAEEAGLPTWLFEESYHIVGDLAETISLILPSPEKQIDKSLSQWIEEIVLQKDRTEEEKRAFITAAWKSLDQNERFLFNKLITGGFRIGISNKLVVKALSKVIEEDENKVAHRLMGNWSPLTTTYEDLLLNTDWQNDDSKPFPFYLAYALDGPIKDLGQEDEWSAEWKWDGIRAQIIRRNGEVFVWTRGEELVTEKYPEFNLLKDLPIRDFVLDGELLVFKDHLVRPFNELQKRIGRKSPGKKTLETYPVVLYAYDLLELDGEDYRDRTFHERRSMLENLVDEISLETEDLIQFSPYVEFESWTELKRKRDLSRSKGAEGFMIKKRSGLYQSGRKRGEWWKWKVDPFTIDAVMIYAQRGHGRRANLFTDFTFAVWNNDGVLVPFAKAYSGLTDVEFRDLTRYVNRNTLERFGPVRSVKPELVFEIAFEGISHSSRHKSGVAVRFPRIKRWRRDKRANEANSLDQLKEILSLYNP